MNVIEETRRALKRVDQREIDSVLKILRDVRDSGGRLFFLGNGGGAGHASHAASDFRKIGGIESYCVADNVSELTARINDDGWNRCYDDWLRASRVTDNDGIFVFSVGGGEVESAFELRSIERAGSGGSENIGRALIARSNVVGVVGARGGEVRHWGKPIIVPSDSTPVVEGCQAVIWHHLVTELAC